MAFDSEKLKQELTPGTLWGCACCRLVWWACCCLCCCRFRPLCWICSLSFSITLAMLILLVTMHSGRPAEFSVFPSVVLLTTLFRLALNIASTRAILLHGNEGPAAAGEVIRVFGEFVVGGNFAVGIVVFSILVIINFVVITKGATRIAEVAARFTLDAMPGGR